MKTTRDLDTGNDNDTRNRAAGGYRGTTGAARFTKQLVALVLPSYRSRIMYLAEKHRVSQAKIMRAVIEAGLGPVEVGLADGTINADTLP